MDPFPNDGFLNIFKPVGMTSHDVVGYIKWRIGAQKAGHAGTLDPAACGVLVVLVNKATKLSERAMQGHKCYRFEILFGVRTDSGNAQGRLLECTPAHVSADTLQSVLPRFTGEIMQMPPMASAVKVHGKRLYKSAHAGISVVRPSRQVTVNKLELVDFQDHEIRPRALLDMECSRGTYVRSVAEDLAAALETVATTTFLIRTAVGPFSVRTATPPGAVSRNTIIERLLPLDFLDTADISFL